MNDSDDEDEFSYIVWIIWTVLITGLVIFIGIKQKKEK